MSTSDDDPPVAGPSSLERPTSRSKWSRRGSRLRRILLFVCKTVALVVAVLRFIRWLVESL